MLWQNAPPVKDGGENVEKCVHAPQPRSTRWTVKNPTSGHSLGPPAIRQRQVHLVPEPEPREPRNANSDGGAGGGDDLQTSRSHTWQKMPMTPKVQPQLWEQVSPTFSSSRGTPD